MWSGTQFFKRSNPLNLFQTLARKIDYDYMGLIASDNAKLIASPTDGTNHRLQVEHKMGTGVLFWHASWATQPFPLFFGFTMELKIHTFLWWWFDFGQNWPFRRRLGRCKPTFFYTSSRTNISREFRIFATFCCLQISFSCPCHCTADQNWRPIFTASWTTNHNH